MAEQTESASGVTLDPYQVILYPLVTEKGTHLSEQYNAYAFAVNTLATKTDIKRAVRELWDVRVTKVRTQSRSGKPRRNKLSRGHTKNWKKAIVTLHDDDRIAFF